ncbi:uncharacterized protein LOC122789477 [Protopterus annectens]|uniref:uncharacterized protein LOC122789477 n=1 Tax=Protopterus annectens TaxID=7888 RepID=UPI001CFA38D6|nr:uncharacterized protein LOC122789477 [Protopterus annectens]
MGGMYRRRGPTHLQLPKETEVSQISLHHQKMPSQKKICLRSIQLSQSFSSMEDSSPELRIPTFKHKNSEPEIFTFESIPKQQQSSSTVRVRKPRRVLYPAKVKKYLPPTESSPAKKWLAFFFCIVLLQVYMEEGVHDGEDSTADHDHRSIPNGDPEGVTLLMSAKISGEILGKLYEVPDNATYGTPIRTSDQEAFHSSRVEAKVPTGQPQEQNSHYRVHQQEYHRASLCDRGFCNYILITVPLLEHRF